jgi:hypothetical protein
MSFTAKPETPIDALFIDELCKLAMDGKPGPWTYSELSDGEARIYCGNANSNGHRDYLSVAPDGPHADSRRLICAMRNALFPLIATVVSQWDELQGYENHCERLVEQMGRTQARALKLEQLMNSASATLAHSAEPFTSGETGVSGGNRGQSALLRVSRSLRGRPIFAGPARRPSCASMLARNVSGPSACWRCSCKRMA